MIKGKRKTKSPCPYCGMGGERCFCSQIPRLDIRTKLSLIIHVRESRKPTNTGKIALQCLVNSNCHERGAPGSTNELIDFLDPNYQPLILFPLEGARELTRELVASYDKPIQLIVPDGNWRQASGAARRYPELHQVPSVMISRKNRATEFIRKESTDYGMATLEAIGHALTIIENEQVGKTLLDLYQLKLARTLQGRGRSDVAD